MDNLKVLIGSPVRQKPAILQEFLQSLMELEQRALQVDYLFVDDNQQQKSTELLNSFQPPQGRVKIIAGKREGQYLCDHREHHWTDTLINNVAHYKDQMIDYARKNHYDYLFLVDSDLVLHPLTLQQLISTQKDIVSNIFWTRFRMDQPVLPQVWVKDEYTLYYQHPAEKLTQQEIASRIQGYLHCLKIPGVYPVGGLGACTLISKGALRSGLCFRELYNLSFVGEDRHFCQRAVALGYTLYVDTHFPAYHIYREKDLTGVAEFKQSCRQHTLPTAPSIRSNTKAKDNKITLCMVVKDEADRYLREVLQHARRYVHRAVIVDDGSSDNTADLCRQLLQGIPLTLVENKESALWGQEAKVRQQAWDLAVATDPDWILCLDADEIFEDAIINNISYLINQPYYDYVAFRLYDFWTPTHYREDEHWQAHKTYRPFLVRYQANYHYQWQDAPLHSGRFPVNISQLPGIISNIRVKHLGWINPLDRAKKYWRYMAVDGEGKYGNLAQYQSILDINPRLVKWE